MNNKLNLNNNLSDNSGKLTILLIVLGSILIIFIAIMVYINFKRYNQYKIQDFIEEELLETVHNCKNELLTIPAEKIPSSSLGNEYSINMWLYVNDYGYKYGEPKYVLMKGSTTSTSGFYNNSNPGMYLDAKKNDLVIDIELQSGTNLSSNTPSPTDDTSFATCRVPNIPLQRWLCINLSLYNNIMDVYLDGKLFKSCIFNGFPKQNNNPMYFGFDGGFDGYVSRITWANKNLSPKQIYSKYEEGPKILEDTMDTIKNKLGLNE
tara:strand:+ start:3069 stop:3860 length:792 start_codon:yes stop_codon:yes gene_type:complete